MANYYRFVGYLMRLVVALWWTVAIILPLTGSLESQPEGWWMIYLFAFVITGMMWVISGFFLKTSENK